MQLYRTIDRCRAIGLTVVVAGMALGGCETTLPSEMSHTEAKQLAQKIYQICLDQGVDYQSTEMETCTKHEAYREIDRRMKNRRTMKEIGIGLQTAAENYRRQQVNCTSVRVGNTISTNCY